MNFSMWPEFLGHARLYTAVLPCSVLRRGDHVASQCDLWIWPRTTCCCLMTNAAQWHFYSFPEALCTNEKSSKVYMAEGICVSVLYLNRAQSCFCSLCPVRSVTLVKNTRFLKACLLTGPFTTNVKDLGWVQACCLSHKQMPALCSYICFL